MFFKKYKNKIKDLERDLSFYQQLSKELQNIINQLKEEKNNLKNINNELNTQIFDMKKISQENKIMRQYYKLDKEPSSDVQAKVLVDLRLHDMEFKMLQQQINFSLWQQQKQQFLSSIFRF